MNSVNLIGRLARDPQTRYTASGMAVCKFTLAVNRRKKDEADFINITAFDKIAENCDRFIGKGSLVGVHGSLVSGSYKNKHDETIYTLEVNANSVEFLDKKKEKEEPQPEFTQIDGDIPF